MRLKEAEAQLRAIQSGSPLSLARRRQQALGAVKKSEKS